MTSLERKFFLSLRDATGDISNNNLLSGVGYPINIGQKVLVSDDGSTLFISALKSADSLYDGEVFVYTYNNSSFSWEFQDSLYQIAYSNISDHDGVNGTYPLYFGKSICCSYDGNTLIAGIPGYRKTNVIAGGFCIFKRTGNTWSFISKHEHGSLVNNYMGYSLACSSDASIIFSGSDSSSYSTSNVYRYAYNSSSGNYEQDTSFDIKPTNSIANSNFGSALDCNDDGTRLVVGSNNYGVYYNSNNRYCGNVQIFHETSGSWSLHSDLFNDISSNLLSGTIISNGNEIGNNVCTNNDGSKILFSSKLYTTINSTVKYGLVHFFQYNSELDTYEYKTQLYSPDFNTTSSINYGDGLAISNDGNHIITSVPGKQIYYYNYDENDSDYWITNSSFTQDIYSYIGSDSTVKYNTSATLTDFGNSLSIDASGMHMGIGIKSYRYDDPTNNSSSIIGQALALRAKVYQTITNFSNITLDYEVSFTLDALTNATTSPTYSKNLQNGETSIFDLSNNEIIITGIGTNLLGVSFAEDDNYLGTTQEVSIQGTPAPQHIYYSEAISTLGSIGIGQKTGLLYEAINSATNALSQLNATLDICGTSVVWDPLTNEFEGIELGTTVVTILLAGDSNYQSAESVVLNFVVQNNWSEAYPSGYDSGYVPSSNGLSFISQNESSLISSEPDVNDINNLFLLGHVNKELDDNEIIYSIPLNTSDEKNELGRSFLKRSNSQFSVQVKDISNSTIDYLSISLKSNSQLSSYQNLKSSDIEIINSLDNTTDIIQIEQFSDDAGGNYEKQPDQYIQLRIYHPYSTLVLYRIDNNHNLTIINNDNYPDSSISRESDNSDYWRIYVPFSSIIGGTSSSGTNATSAICFDHDALVYCDQGYVKISKINPCYHTINNEKILHITKVRNRDKQIVHIKKHAFGENIPMNNVNISLNHRLLFNGKMIKARHLATQYPNYCKIIHHNDILYNVLMKKYTIMNVENMIVETLDPKHIVARFTRFIHKHLENKTIDNNKLHRIISMANK